MCILNKRVTNLETKLLIRVLVHVKIKTLQPWLTKLHFDKTGIFKWRLAELVNYCPFQLRSGKPYKTAILDWELVMDNAT